MLGLRDLPLHLENLTKGAPQVAPNNRFCEALLLGSTHNLLLAFGVCGPVCGLGKPPVLGVSGGQGSVPITWGEREAPRAL